MITLNPTLGTFLGTFNLVDTDGYAANNSVTRKITVEGVILPGGQALGFFLLSKLQADAEHPALPANPATTTSQLSGWVRLAAPPGEP
jgi:hypothetical protein